jgi:hypothetical protein
MAYVTSYNFQILHNLFSDLCVYCCILKYRNVRWVGHTAQMGGQKCIYIFMRKFHASWPVSILSVRWKRSIKMDMREIGCEDERWI